MLAVELADILRRSRTDRPADIRSALRSIDASIGRYFPLCASILEIPGENTIYLTSGTDFPGEPGKKMIRETVSDPSKRWIVVDRSDHRSCARKGPERDAGAAEGYAIHSIPVFAGESERATLYLMTEGCGPSLGHSLTGLSEVVSSVLSGFVDPIRDDPAQLQQTMKIELLESTKDETAMKQVLLRMMEKAQSEFCAFFSGVGDPCLHIMLDSRELSPRLPEIREKLLNSYRMFANKARDAEYCREKVYYRNRHKNISYLVGNSRIESYFLVPVLFDATVTGVLYFGSVREDAFVRETISFFDGMAGEDDAESGIMYMLRGETSVISNVIDLIPDGCALLSKDGSIVHANSLFSLLLGLEGAMPEELEEIGRMTGFSLTGPFSEFRMTGRVDSRELRADDDGDRCLAVDIVRLDKITPQISSLMILKDMTAEKEMERSTEEMLAMVAHELRTPMTGLKNSLRLMNGNLTSGRNGEGDGKSDTDERRFLDTAIRTVDRLNVLVDGIVDTSPVRSRARKPHLDECDTEEFLRESCRIYEGTFGKKDIGLHISIAEGAGSLYIDHDMMSQVIQNLLSNSLKNVPSGGRIRIDVSVETGQASGAEAALPSSLVPDARYTRVRISDTGPGIPGDVISRINSPEDASGRNRKRFRGLGLYISGRLIDAHGGMMKARTRDRDGGTIDLLIPADSHTSSAVLSVRSSRSAFNSMVAAGKTPVVGIVTRMQRGCWIETTREWPVRPLIFPEEEDTAGCECCLWPISEGIAVYLSATEMKYQGRTASEDPDEYPCPEGVICGFSKYPADGRKFAVLLERSVDAVSAGMIINH